MRTEGEVILQVFTVLWVNGSKSFNTTVFKYSFRGLLIYFEVRAESWDLDTDFFFSQVLLLQLTYSYYRIKIL